MKSARQRTARSMSDEYTTAVRRRRRSGAPQYASISYHEGSGAMAKVPVVDRPREKLVRVGADALGDNELVALVLGTGQRDRSALELANALLGAVGGLHRLTRTTPDGLCVVPGVGAAQAARLLAAVELGRCTLLQPPADRPQLRSPRETAAFLLPRFSARPVEHFGVVLLDVRCRVIRVAL